MPQFHVVVVFLAVVVAAVVVVDVHDDVLQQRTAVQMLDDVHEHVADSRH